MDLTEVSVVGKTVASISDLVGDENRELDLFFLFLNLFFLPI